MAKYLLAAGVILLGVLVWALNSKNHVGRTDPNAKVTKENFDLIGNGTPRAEVHRLLGRPTMKSAQDNCDAWGDGTTEDGLAAVWYDEHGRVAMKAWHGKP